MDRNILGSLAVRYEGNWQKIAAAVKRDEQIILPVKDTFITIMDREYPECLRELAYPPWVLFYEGDISLLQKPMVSVVGSRRLIPYGRKMTELVSSVLAEKYTVVSGMAKGADACAHSAAMKKGRTVGVIGSGLGTSYPKENLALYKEMRKTQLIISEFPHDTGVRKHHFPWRNRILAALGSRIFVTQAEEKSGTMITVNEALELAKDVYCVPYPFASREGKGCSRLIAEGAMILYDIEQLREIAALQDGITRQNV